MDPFTVVRHNSEKGAIIILTWATLDFTTAIT
jgi:hypothetical protein